MVLRNEIEEISKEDVGLISSYSVDTLCEPLVYEDGLPSSYSWGLLVDESLGAGERRRTICADHWVNCLESRSVI